MPAAALPQAVAYCHALALDSSLHGEVIDAPKAVGGQYFSNAEVARLNAVCTHMVWVAGWFSEYKAALGKIAPRMTCCLYDHFNDGAGLARMTAKVTGKTLDDADFIRHFPWNKEFDEQHRYCQLSR